MNKLILGFATIAILMTSPSRAVQLDRADFCGKTPDQIVKMGVEKWTDLHGRIHGTSTMAMSAAMYVWGDARKQIHDRRVRRLPQGHRALINAFREQAGKFASQCQEVGEAVTGGGTLWRNINSGIPSDIEDVVAATIAQPSAHWGSSKAAKGGIVLTKPKFAEILARAKKAEAEAKAGEYHSALYESGVKAAGGLELSYQKVMALAAQMPSKAKAALRKFVNQEIELTKGYE